MPNELYALHLRLAPTALPRGRHVIGPSNDQLSETRLERVSEDDRPDALCKRDVVALRAAEQRDEGKSAAVILVHRGSSSSTRKVSSTWCQAGSNCGHSSSSIERLSCNQVHRRLSFVWSRVSPSYVCFPGRAWGFSISAVRNQCAAIKRVSIIIPDPA